MQHLEVENANCNYFNPCVVDAEKRCGPYIYSAREENDIRVIKKNLVCLDNGSLYSGEWNENNEREGRGIQI